MAGDGVTKAEKPPSKQDGRLALQRREVSHGDVALGALLQTVPLSPKWQASLSALLGAALLTPLYIRMATVALLSPRAGAVVTLRRVQSPCALCRGGRASFERKEASRGKKPRRAFRLDALSRRGPSPRVSPWRESPGLKSLSRLGESLVLSENLLKNLVGPGRPARGTLVSTVPTVAPGPTMGTPRPKDEGEASRAQRCLPGP